MFGFGQWIEKSRTFQNFFLHHQHLVDRDRFGVFHVARSVNDLNLAMCEAFWWDRSPQIKWVPCGFDGCTEPVPEGELCVIHSLSNKKPMPTWKMFRGDVYKWSNIGYEKTTRYSGKNGKTIESEYLNYLFLIGEDNHGKIPKWASFFWADHNPMNFAAANIIVLSDYSLSAVKSGVINSMQAVELDEVIGKKYGEVSRRNSPFHLCKKHGIVTLVELCAAFGSLFGPPSRGHVYLETSINKAGHSFLNKSELLEYVAKVIKDRRETGRQEQAR